MIQKRFLDTNIAVIGTHRLNYLSVPDIVKRVERYHKKSRDLIALSFICKARKSTEIPPMLSSRTRKKKVNMFLSSSSPQKL